MSEIIKDKPDCETCGHSPDLHSCSDDADLDSPDIKFSCNGPNFDGCDLECPDYEGEITFTEEP